MTRYVMIIDLKSCIGCRACMTACKCNNNIPIGEYRGREYYRIWPDEKEFGNYPYVFRNFTPILCMHCADPPCIDECPNPGAIYAREDGIVLIDEEKCNGCKTCIQACPYDAIYFRQDKGVVDKCNFCFDRVDEGLQPECVKTCPSNAILFNDIDDPKSGISKYIDDYNAKPLHPEYKINPSIYYTAHAGRVGGKVVERPSKIPVKGAIVTLKNAEKDESFSTTTDINGVFFFWNLNTSILYELGVEIQDYKPYHVSLNLSEEYVDIGNIEIQKL